MFVDDQSELTIQTAVSPSKASPTPSEHQYTITQMSRKLSNPNTAEKQWVNKYRKICLFHAGALLLQDKTMNKTELEHKMMNNYVDFVNQHDPYTDEEIEKHLGKPPRTSIFEDVIRPRVFGEVHPVYERI